MISGYAQQGYGEQAFYLFGLMQQEGLKQWCPPYNWKSRNNSETGHEGTLTHHRKLNLSQTSTWWLHLSECIQSMVVWQMVTGCLTECWHKIWHHGLWWFQDMLSRDILKRHLNSFTRCMQMIWRLTRPHYQHSHYVRKSSTAGTG